MRTTAKQTTTTHCLRCGRTLRATTSIAAGYGRTCKTKVRKAAETAALADFKPFQIAKAREVIEQKAVVPTARPNVFQIASSDGTAVYRTARQGCTCPAGLKSRACYHRAAVAILTAA